MKYVYNVVTFVVTIHMASLRKSPKSPYYIACITLADGKRTQKSTKSTDRKKAQRIADLMEEAELEAKEGRLTEVAVRKHVANAYQIATGSKMNSYTIRSWLEWWLKNKVKAKRKTTSERYKGTIQSFITFLGSRADLDINHAGQQDAEGFREELLSIGKNNRTVNVDIKTVSSAFNLAKKNALIDHNPFAALDSLSVEESKRKPFDQAQVAQILANGEGEWKGLCVVGYCTGMRLSDVTKLDWESIDLKAEIPVLRIKWETKKQDKHRRELVIPVHAMLNRFLRSQSGRKKGFLFPSAQKTGTGGHTGLSRQFRLILLEAKILKEPKTKVRRKKGSVARAQSEYSFHSFRHTFKSMLANKGVPSEVYDTLSGHSKPSVAEAYVHRNLEVLEEAISRLPDIPFD